MYILDIIFQAKSLDNNFRTNIIVMVFKTITDLLKI